MNKKLWDIYRSDQFVGSVREVSEEAACNAYAEYAKCSADLLHAKLAGAQPKSAEASRFVSPPRAIEPSFSSPAAWPFPTAPAPVESTPEREPTFSSGGGGDFGGGGASSSWSDSSSSSSSSSSSDSSSSSSSDSGSCSSSSSD